MRVFFIYPPITDRERYSSDIGAAGGRQIPLGVFSMAAATRAAGHEVGVLDAAARELSTRQSAQRAAEFKPDVVGISAATLAFNRARELAIALRKAAPGTVLVLGGPHVSAAPEEALAEPLFDFGVVGEGEATFAEALSVLAAGGDLSEVAGLVLRKNGKPFRTPARPPIMDLDELPFPAYDMLGDFSLYNPPPCNYKKKPVANVITSRGCPGRCTFCDRSVFGRRFRPRSALSIAREIELLFSSYGVREIAFVDDTFTLGRDRIYRLFEILEGRGISFPWTCMSRVNTVDREFLRFMRDKGLWHVSFGIESGDQEILKKIGKKISLEKARQVVAWCRELKIETKGFFMLGHPGETEESMEKTVREALSMDLSDVVVTINTPLPGSEQFKNARLYGTLDGSDLARFNMWAPVFVPYGLTAARLVDKHREFYRRFYLRPRIVGRYLASFFSVTGLDRARALIAASPFLFRRNKVKS